MIHIRFQGEITVDDGHSHERDVEHKLKHLQESIDCLTADVQTLKDGMAELLANMHRVIGIKSTHGDPPAGEPAPPPVP